MRSFFFNDTATTEIYTLSLHDALPISAVAHLQRREVLDVGVHRGREAAQQPGPVGRDRKSTRLNSSHANISYAVFCLKKKKTHPPPTARIPSSCSTRLLCLTIPPPLSS